MPLGILGGGYQSERRWPGYHHPDPGPKPQLPELEPGLVRKRPSGLSPDLGTPVLLCPLHLAAPHPDEVWRGGRGLTCPTGPCLALPHHARATSTLAASKSDRSTLETWSPLLRKFSLCPGPRCPHWKQGCWAVWHAEAAPLLDGDGGQGPALGGGRAASSLAWGLAWAGQEAQPP